MPGKPWTYDEKLILLREYEAGPGASRRLAELLGRPVGSVETAKNRMMSDMRLPHAIRKRARDLPINRDYSDAGK